MLESGLFDSEIGNQLESSQVAGTDPERLGLENVDLPSSSLGVEESKMDASSDKSPLSCLLAKHKPEDGVTEEKCGKAIVVSQPHPLGICICGTVSVLSLLFASGIYFFIIP